MWYVSRRVSYFRLTQFWIFMSHMTESTFRFFFLFYFFLALIKTVSNHTNVVSMEFLWNRGLKNKVVLKFETSKVHGINENIRKWSTVFSFVTTIFVVVLEPKLLYQADSNTTTCSIVLLNLIFVIFEMFLPLFLLVKTWFFVKDFRNYFKFNFKFNRNKNSAFVKPNFCVKMKSLFVLCLFAFMCVFSIEICEVEKFYIFILLKIWYHFSRYCFLCLFARSRAEKKFYFIF